MARTSRAQMRTEAIAQADSRALRTGRRCRAFETLEQRAGDAEPIPYFYVVADEPPPAGGTLFYTAEPAYRWASPGEWLSWKIERADLRAVSDAIGPDDDGAGRVILDAARAFAQLDAGTIQDEFQQDMDADGYFKPSGVTGRT